MRQKRCIERIYFTVSNSEITRCLFPFFKITIGISLKTDSVEKNELEVKEVTIAFVNLNYRGRKDLKELYGKLSTKRTEDKDRLARQVGAARKKGPGIRGLEA